MNIRITTGASAALHATAQRSRSETLLAALKRWFAAYRALRIRRAATAALFAMNDRDLKDIGITRGEIERAVRGEVTRERVLRRYY